MSVNWTGNTLSARGLKISHFHIYFLFIRMRLKNNPSNPSLNVKQKVTEHEVVREQLLKTYLLLSIWSVQKHMKMSEWLFLYRILVVFGCSFIHFDYLLSTVEGCDIQKFNTANIYTV